ncbi:tyrosine-protein phosphatase Lar-like protein, partial [Leptotrombidium deliense]
MFFASNNQLVTFIILLSLNSISCEESKTSPRNVQARPLSSSTIVIQWDPPEEPNGEVTSYQVYYTINPSEAITQWKSQNVDSNLLTTVSDLQPRVIYTIRVRAHTSRGLSPLSAPTQVKTQQGVPSQPKNLRA